MAIIIQKQIKVSDKWIESLIEGYKKMPKKYHLAFGEFSGDRDDIIKEIKKRSEVGKRMMIMRYTFEKTFPKEKLEDTTTNKK